MEKNRVKLARIVQSSAEARRLLYRVWRCSWTIGCWSNGLGLFLRIETGWGLKRNCAAHYHGDTLFRRNPVDAVHD